LLNEMLVALASFDCRRALALLAESVAEYRVVHAVSDYIWTRKTIAAATEGGKVADFAAKRRHSDAAGKPSQGTHPT
ncbi:MAG: hypothetical protein ABI885_28065, partial [Gammaproteobacteria bacterium]